ncbi:hypothetical protein M231_02458 [Tremella mesenterica]|uniref:RRM domain-containing protein n=1 Tax=Tremella mesenterica TaxID=5217 RepID=A0A4Q1BQH4_TREME|nr:hypothetical protein M231_02458 [Tremella mesenterica]
MRSKPYERSKPYPKANPDAGPWKHDLAPSVTSLASRISTSQPSLLSRISGGQGKELLPISKSGTSQGFPTPTSNGGKELLGPTRQKRLSRSVVENKAVADALGLGRRGREHVVGGRELLPANRGNNGLFSNGGTELQSSSTVPGGVAGPVSGFMRGVGGQEGVRIVGAAKGSVWVRVGNLAFGTTADDVMSAFSPAPILSAKSSPTSTPEIISVDLEFPSRAEAEIIVGQYNGIVADGNTLHVTILNPSLKERMGGIEQNSSSLSRRMGNGNGNGNGGLRAEAGVFIPRKEPDPAPRELVDEGITGKLYSDQILATQPKTGIITLADPTSSSSAARNRAEVWRTVQPTLTLAQRVGAARR